MSEKPDWSLVLRAALDMERKAEIMRSIALRMRCGEEDSGGARCTADASSDHFHRHAMEDLP